MNPKFDLNIQWGEFMLLIHNQVRPIVCIAGRAALFFLLAGLLAGSTRGQAAGMVTPQLEASGAFSYVRGRAADSGAGFNLLGGSGSIAYNFRDRFAIVGDFGAYRFTNLSGGLSSTMYTYVAGPRLTLRNDHRLRPFAQALFGGGRLNASSGGVSAGENGFVMSLGGGLDYTIEPRLALRVIEADYLLTRFAHPDGSSATQNNVRLSVGLVFRFGNHQ